MYLGQSRVGRQVENLLNSVIAAERNALVPGTKLYAERRYEKRIQPERVNTLAETLNDKARQRQPGTSHGYMYLGAGTRRIEQLLSVYEHDGQYIVLIRDAMYCCESLADAKSCLQTWAAGDE